MDTHTYEAREKSAKVDGCDIVCVCVGGGGGGGGREVYSCAGFHCTRINRCSLIFIPNLTLYPLLDDV